MYAFWTGRLGSMGFAGAVRELWVGSGRGISLAFIHSIFFHSFCSGQFPFFFFFKIDLSCPPTCLSPGSYHLFRPIGVALFSIKLSPDDHPHFNSKFPFCFPLIISETWLLNDQTQCYADAM